MNKPLILTLIINGLLLSGCQNLPVAALESQLTGGAIGGNSNGLQDVWVDAQGYQVPQQELAACNVTSQQITQQEATASGADKDVNLLNILKNQFHDMGEQSKQLDLCMQGKNYVKTQAAPGKMPSQRAAANGPAPIPSYAPALAAPQGYVPAQGYAPVPQGYVPAPQGYVPAQGYAPAPQGYAPAPQGYVPAPQGYVPAQGYAPAPQGYVPAPQGYVPAPATRADGQ
jgi:hypothetical protein